MHKHVKGSFFFFGEDTSSTNRVSHDVSKSQIVNFTAVGFLFKCNLCFIIKKGAVFLLLCCPTRCFHHLVLIKFSVVVLFILSPAVPPICCPGLCFCDDVHCIFACHPQVCGLVVLHVHRGAHAGGVHCCSVK